MKVVQMVLFLYWSSCYAFFKLAGPYEVTLEDMADCENVGTGQLRHALRMRKVNATTRLLQGGADYKIPVDDNLSYELIANKWTSGGWGMNAYVANGADLCSTFRANIFEVFETFFKALGVASECPIAAGSYKMVSGMGLTFKKLKNFPSLPYGRYRTELKLLIAGDVVGCVRLTCSIEEIANN